MIRKALLIGILATAFLLAVVVLSRFDTRVAKLDEADSTLEDDPGRVVIHGQNFRVEAERLWQRQAPDDDTEQQWWRLVKPVITFFGDNPTVIVADRGRYRADRNRGTLTGNVVARLNDEDDTVITTETIHFDDSLELGVFTDEPIHIDSRRMVIDGRRLRGRTDMNYFRIERLSPMGIVLKEQSLAVTDAADADPDAPPSHMHILCKGAVEYTRYALADADGRPVRNGRDDPVYGSRIDIHDDIRVRQVDDRSFHQIMAGKPPTAAAPAGLDAETLLTVTIVERPAGDDEPTDEETTAEPEKKRAIDAVRAHSDTPGRTYFFTPDGRRGWGDTLTWRNEIMTLTGADPKAIWRIDEAQQAVITRFSTLTIAGRRSVNIVREEGEPFLLVDQRGGGASRDILGARVVIDPQTGRMDVYGEGDRPAEIHPKDDRGNRTGDALMGDHILYTERTVVTGADHAPRGDIWPALRHALGVARLATHATLPTGIDPLPPLVRDERTVTLDGNGRMQQDDAVLTAAVIRLGQDAEGRDIVDADGAGQLVFTEEEEEEEDNAELGDGIDPGNAPPVDPDALPAPDPPLVDGDAPAEAPDDDVVAAPLPMPERTVITWVDGMTFRGAEATFRGEVLAKQGVASTMRSDRLDILFAETGPSRDIRRLEATGRVRIEEGNQVATGRRFVRDVAEGTNRLFGADDDPAKVVSGIHRDTLYSREIEFDRDAGRLVGKGRGRMRHTIVPVPDAQGLARPTQTLLARWSEGMVYDEAIEPDLGRITLTGDVHTIRLPEIRTDATVRLVTDTLGALAAARPAAWRDLPSLLARTALPYDTLDCRRLELFIVSETQPDPRTGGTERSQRLQRLVAHEDVTAVFRDETGASRGTGERMTWNNDRARAVLVGAGPDRPARAFYRQNTLVGPELIYSRRETDDGVIDTSLVVRGPGHLDYRDAASADGADRSVHVEWNESAYYSMAKRIGIFVGDPWLTRKGTGDRLKASRRIVLRFGEAPGTGSLELRRIAALGDKAGSVSLRHGKSRSRGNLFVWDADTGDGRIVDTEGDPVKLLEAGSSSAIEAGTIVISDKRGGPRGGVTVDKTPRTPIEKPLLGPEGDDGWKEILQE